MNDLLPYQDRTQAGRVLAENLEAYREIRDLLVLGLPRGGVPVAFEVAQALGAELDVLTVRKLGVPECEELAMGAIADGGVTLRNENVLAGNASLVSSFPCVERREREELLRRERDYRGARPIAEIASRCVILVDDGLATGSTMRAAIEASRRLGARQIVVAVPVAPSDTVEQLRDVVDDIVCPAVPLQFRAIGWFYRDFSQVSDREVRSLLRLAGERGTL